MHIGIRGHRHHLFRQWLFAYSVPSHYLNLCWLVVREAHQILFNRILVKLELLSIQTSCQTNYMVLHGLFWVWAEPMTDITLWCGLSLAEPLPRIIPVLSTILARVHIYKWGLAISWSMDKKLHPHKTVGVIIPSWHNWLVFNIWTTTEIRTWMPNYIPQNIKGCNDLSMP